MSRTREKSLPSVTVFLGSHLDSTTYIAEQWCQGHHNAQLVYPGQSLDHLRHDHVAVYALVIGMYRPDTLPHHRVITVLS